MPSRNVIKIDVPESYYHVYARGASRKEIFLEGADYQYFLSLFARYLSVEQQRDRTGRAYAHLTESLELLAYCLVPNHFHIMDSKDNPWNKAGERQADDRRWVAFI